MSGVRIEGVDLYSGDDLAAAAELSRFDVDFAARSGTGSVARLWRDLKGARLRDFLPRTKWVAAAADCADRDLTVQFRGSLRMLPYCSDVFFGPDNWQTTTAADAASSGPDLIVSDQPWFTRPGQPLVTVSTPPWVRLELGVAASWDATLAALPSVQVKRIGRFLRRFGYSASVRSGDSTLRQFYREFYLPELRRRFGDTAIIESERDFLAANRFSLRLDLTARDTVIASNILAPGSSRLAIARGARNPQAGDFKGQTDTLDYFTLLIAQLAGFKVLDFGLSRAHL